MEINKNLRSTIAPSKDLYRRDVRTSIKAAQTGVFTRNCVLSGKRAGDMDYPIYIRTPGIVSTYSSVCPDGIGYFESSEGNANNVFPMHKDLTNNNTYWEATTLGANITYCHPLRPTTIRTYRFITINGYTPRTWKIQGSNDNTNWTTLHEVTVSWTWDDGKNKVQFDIPLENRAEYKYHRLQIDEFDTTSVRIYSLQFYDSLCSTNSSFYLDASAENPLQLAFADGYNVDGTPKDIIKMITTGQEIEISDVFFIPDTHGTTNPYNVNLFCVYGFLTDNISFYSDAFNSEDFFPVDIYNKMIVISNSHWRYPEKIFDGDIDTYSDISDGYSYAIGNIYFESPFPIITNRFKIKYHVSADDSIDYCYVYFSEDNRNSWNKVFSGSPSGVKTDVVELDRIYNITDIRLYQGGYHNQPYGIYHISFDDATRSNIRKFSNGKLYEYNKITEIWEHVYKIPLGYVTLTRNPENTNWEIANFIPTNIPQMTFAPYFRKTSY